MPKRPKNSIERFLAKIRRNKLVTLLIALGVGIIALANFTKALTELGNFLGIHVARDTDIAEAKTAIRNSIRDLEHKSPGDARRALSVIEGTVAGATASEIKNVALRELVQLISDVASPSDRVREIRKAVMESIVRLNGRDLASLFSGEELQGVDLYGMDLHNVNLRKVNLQRCFAVEANFEGANLDEADFYGAYLRNAKFGGASVIGTDFDNTDWFNSAGFTVPQLQSAKRKTLMLCPRTEEEMRRYLKRTYDFSFDDWGADIQSQLRTNWKTYWTPSGLADAVTNWHSE
jgi:uncharacterized protein YjbI with pentapeptide repeats